MGNYIFWKPVLDFAFAFLLLLILFPVILIIVLIVSVIYLENPLFKQVRVGQKSRLFVIYKVKTMHPSTNEINSFTGLLRKSKLDELPQLLNILKGEMSFVGPRPDVPGYYDCLKGDDLRLAILKPGLTSRASIKYRDEDDILKSKDNPQDYNDNVIFPDKIKLNLDYLDKISLKEDVSIIFETIRLV